MLIAVMFWLSMAVGETPVAQGLSAVRHLQSKPGVDSSNDLVDNLLIL